MSRSYPAFGKVKTIALPLPPTSMTAKQYKDAFGIDVRDIFELTTGYDIYLKTKLGFVLLYDTENTFYENTEMTLGHNSYIPVISASKVSSWVEEAHNAQTIFGFYNSSEETTIGLKVSIDKSSPFECDSIVLETVSV